MVNFKRMTLLILWEKMTGNLSGNSSRSSRTPGENRPHIRTSKKTKEFNEEHSLTGVSKVSLDLFSVVRVTLSTWPSYSLGVEWWRKWWRESCESVGCEGELKPHNDTYGLNYRTVQSIMCHLLSVESSVPGNHRVPVCQSEIITFVSTKNFFPIHKHLLTDSRTRSTSI